MRVADAARTESYIRVWLLCEDDNAVEIVGQSRRPVRSSDAGEGFDDRAARHGARHDCRLP